MITLAQWLGRAVVMLAVLGAVVGGLVLAVGSIIDGRWGAALFQVVGAAVVLGLVVRIRTAGPPRDAL